MEPKKYNVTIKEELQGGSYRSQWQVADLCELIETLVNKGISVVDFENSTPFDNLPHLIKSDVSIYDLTQNDFDLLTKTIDHIPYLVPVNVLSRTKENPIEDALINGIRKTVNRFRERPFYYFTESDIHSSLAKDIMDGNSESLLYRDKNSNIEISLLHSEYPTNFRYSKKKLLNGYRNLYDKGSDDRIETLICSKDGDRGNYDLAIINREFVERVLKKPLRVDKNTNRNKVTDLSEAIKHIINKNIKYPLRRCRKSLKSSCNDASYARELETELSYAIEVKFIHPFNARYKNMLDEVIKDNTKLSLARAHSNCFTKTINLIFCSSEKQERSDNKAPVIEKLGDYIENTTIIGYDEKQYSIPNGVINIFIESFLSDDTKKTPKPIISIGGSIKNNDLVKKLKDSLKTAVK